MMQPFVAVSQPSTFHEPQAGGKSWDCLMKANNPPLSRLCRTIKNHYFAVSQLSPTRPMHHLVLPATLPAARPYQDH
jgi:hypothetical protein